MNLRISTLDMELTTVNTNYKERLGVVMKLKVGDVVEFKKYEDMTGGESMGISDKVFPRYGKITEVVSDDFFYIEGYGYLLNPKSVTRVINNANRFNQGDEILVKATVKKVFNDYLQIESSIDDSDVVKVLKRITPNCFIVQEKYYGLYIGASGDLVSDKDRAQIYTSQEDANTDAADMYLSRWDVIPYGTER